MLARTMAPGRIATLLLTLGALLTGACRPDPGCARSTDCPAGTVCQPDGRCEPLGKGARVRAMEAHRLEPTDWGVTRRDRIATASPVHDELLLGGAPDAAIHFAFPAVPEARRAILTLFPHGAWDGPDEGVTVIVQRIDPFVGAQLTHENRPSPRGLPLTVRRVRPAVGQPVRLDVTDAFRRQAGPVHLAVRVSGRATRRPFRFASPRATEPDRRPRVDVLAR